MAATERLFDRWLLAIAFPPAIEPVAGRQLGLFERRLAAANSPVEHAVRVIRSRLGLPPQVS
jgi:hypothetical protein